MGKTGDKQIIFKKLLFLKKCIILYREANNKLTNLKLINKTSWYYLTRHVTVIHPVLEFVQSLKRLIYLKKTITIFLPSLFESL